MKKNILIIACAIILSSCNKFEYHPYDTDVHYKHLNATAIEQIERECAGRETIRFVWMGDSQRWYDETEAMARSVNARGDVDFVMHGGDLTDWGLNNEYDWMHRKMRQLEIPYVALIGNHDFQGNGYHIFTRMYGPENFSFVAGDVKFVCLNTNYLELHHAGATPDFRFIENELDNPRGSHKTVVAMHSGPECEQWNYTSEHIFKHKMREFPGLQFCLHAHVHRLVLEKDYFDDGTIYFGCDAMKNRSYLLFTITPDPEDCDYEVVYF